MARRACAEPRPGKLSGISTFARETRASRPLAHVGAELSRRITALEIARAQLFDVDVDRRKRIDDAIDYFGTGHIDVAQNSARQRRLARIERLTTRFRRACRIHPRAGR